MKVSLYRCFTIDQRISMDIYADSLHQALSGNANLEVSSFTPSSWLEYFSTSHNIKRFLRYFQYPMMIRNIKADIHHIVDHGYAHLLPKISSGKTCIPVHDLIPLLSWNGTIKIKDSVNGNALKFRKPYLNLASLKHLKDYDQIIASSQNTFNDLVEFLGLDENKITVISPIISSYFCHVAEKKVEQFRSKHELSKSIKWVMISGNSYYKNHETCLKVLLKLNQQSEVPVMMIRTGLASKDFEEKVAAMNLSGLVRNLFLPEIIDLPSLYCSVDCLLFPSLYEGFGMPVAEALACGTPVVTSNRGSLGEVAGELAPQFDPYDLAGLTKAVYQALFEPSIKQTTLEKGHEWVKQFRAEPITQKIEDVYASLEMDA